MLNTMEREAADNAINALQDSFNEKELSQLRAMLFRFEDIVRLEPAVRSMVFDSLAAETITLALRDCSESLQEAVLSSISQRTRRIIENDLKAQAKITPCINSRCEKADCRGHNGNGCTRTCIPAAR